MKILVVTPWYPNPMQPPLGLFVRDQVAALATLADVAVLAPRVPFERWRGKGPDPQPPLQGVKEFRPKAPWWGFKNLKMAGFERKCLEYADRVEASLGIPDIIHAHTTPGGGTAGLALKKRWGCKLVITEHIGPFESILVGGMKQKVLSTLQAADAVIAVSPFQKERMEAAGVSRSIDVVGNIICEMPPPKPGGANSEVIRMFSLGSPGELKGTDILLGALQLMSGVRNFKLRIAGGPVDQRWVELAGQLGLADRVEFLGNMPREEILQEFVACDVFLHASRYESFCSAAAEALSAGKPVVITPCGGPETFVNEACGVVATGFTANEFASAMNNWFDNRERYSAEKIADGIRGRFSAEAIAGELMTIFHRVLKAA